MTYKSKLILFPRRDGKAKKGLINDSTAAQVQSASAANQVAGKVLPKTVVVNEDKFEAITADMKKKNAHSEARILWTNARYVGKRQKKAEEEAAKAK